MSGKARTCELQSISEPYHQVLCLCQFSCVCRANTLSI